METYEEILLRMQDKYKKITGCDADDASDIGIRLKVLAGELLSIEANIDWLKNQMFAQTATGKQLEYHASERGLKRKAALCSTGTLSFSRESALDYDVLIPKGTVCSTTGVNGTRYETTDDAVLDAGKLSITVNAQSCEGGADKIASKGSVTVMVDPPAGITSVTNEAAFIGCAAEETDDELRARILNSYKNISNGTNSAFYKEEILKYDGVHSVSVVPLARGNGTVDIYVAGKGETLSSDIISKIQSGIDKLREINVDIKIKSPTLVKTGVKVNIYVEEGYTFSNVKNDCISAITDYYNNLGIGEPLLLADIGEVIYHIEGVKNYIYPLGGNLDVSATSSQLIVCEGIIINEGT